MKRTTKDLITALYKSVHGAIFVYVLFFITAIYSGENTALWNFAVNYSIIASIIGGIVAFYINGRYVFDFESGNFTFPATDVAHNILEVIFLIPFFNLFSSKTVHITDVERMYLNIERGKKGKTFYNINVTGTFGSAKLEFKTRQKRDETRNNLNQLKKEFDGKNIDFQVAEFN